MQLTESEIHAIKQRVKKRIEEGLKRDEIMGIIKGLARSQGSYSRLYQFLRSGCDDAESMIQDLEDKCFNDAVDMIMYLEEGCQKKGKLVNEGQITSMAANTLQNCNRGLNAILHEIQNEFSKVYGMISDSENPHKAISKYRDLMDKFTYHEYEQRINNAYKPIIDAYIANNNNNTDEFSEPEDWYERNEHGDFDDY